MADTNFSVSMCVYGKDEPSWFETAVNSILHQTTPPSEVVLVVDGPVPNQLDEVIKRYETMPIFKVIRLPQNQGHGEARRIGLEACSYELVAIMDSDDISVSNRFEKQLLVFESDRNIDVVGGNITEFISSPNQSVGRRVVPQKHEEICEYMKDRCPMNLVTVMFKKSSIQSVGGFIDWFCEEDYYLWIRMYQAGMQFANVSDDLVNVRVGKEMYQRRGGWKYFKSEAKLQTYMRKNRIITLGTYLKNISKRFVVQVLLPNRVRGWVFRKFARKSV